METINKKLATIKLPMAIFYMAKGYINGAVVTKIVIAENGTKYVTKAGQEINIEDAISTAHWEAKEYKEVWPAQAYRIGSQVFGVTSGSTSYLPGMDGTIKHIQQHSDAVQAMKHVVLNATSGVAITDFSALNKFFCAETEIRGFPRCHVQCPYCQSI